MPIKWVRIEFVKAWGHPTRNLILGAGDRAVVSRSIANNLTRDGYAKILDEKTNPPENDFRNRK